MTDEMRDSLGALFKAPVPRRADGEIDVFNLVFAEGPCEGKRLGDCTKRDIEQMRAYAEAGTSTYLALQRLLEARR